MTPGVKPEGVKYKSPSRHAVGVSEVVGDEPAVEQLADCAHLGGGESYRMDGTYALTLNATVEQVWSNVDQYIEDSGSEILFEKTTMEGERYIHFVERTSFWRFPDDVAVSVSPLGDVTTCQLELHSQSRLGQSDLGVNPNRIEDLYNALTDGS